MSKAPKIDPLVLALQIFSKAMLERHEYFDASKSYMDTIRTTLPFGKELPPYEELLKTEPHLVGLKTRIEVADSVVREQFIEAVRLGMQEIQQQPNHGEKGIQNTTGKHPSRGRRTNKARTSDGSADRSEP